MSQQPDRLSDTPRQRSADLPAANSSLMLVLRAQNGDELAREELCARYLPRLRRWAHGRMPGWARQHLDTEDIVQETLLRSIGQLDGFSARSRSGVLGVYLPGASQSFD